MDREAAARDVTLAHVFEPTGALAAYLHAKRTAERLRRAAGEGRLSQAALATSALPFGSRVLLAVAIGLPLALLLSIAIGGTLFGWAAPSAAARAVEAVRGLLGALGLPGETPWLPSARDMAAYWAARGVADRGVVFAAAADASASLSLALVPLMVLPLWAMGARRRFASLVPPDPAILRRGRLFGAGAVTLVAVLAWGCAHLLFYGAVDPTRAARAGDLRASLFAPTWCALMALCGPGFASALPTLAVDYVIRPPTR